MSFSAFSNVHAANLHATHHQRKFSIVNRRVLLLDVILAMTVMITNIWPVIYLLVLVFGFEIRCTTST